MAWVLAEGDLKGWVEQTSATLQYKKGGDTSVEKIFLIKQEVIVPSSSLVEKASITRLELVLPSVEKRLERLPERIKIFFNGTNRSHQYPDQGEYLSTVLTDYTEEQLVDLFDYLQNELGVSADIIEQIKLLVRPREKTANEIQFFKELDEGVTKGNFENLFKQAKSVCEPKQMTGSYQNTCDALFKLGQACSAAGLLEEAYDVFKAIDEDNCYYACKEYEVTNLIAFGQQAPVNQDEASQHEFLGTTLERLLEEGEGLLSTSNSLAVFSKLLASYSGCDIQGITQFGSDKDENFVFSFIRDIVKLADTMYHLSKENQRLKQQLSVGPVVSSQVGLGIEQKEQKERKEQTESHSLRLKQLSVMAVGSSQTGLEIEQDDQYNQSSPLLFSTSIPVSTSSSSSFYTSACSSSVSQSSVDSLRVSQFSSNSTIPPSPSSLTTASSSTEENLGSSLISTPQALGLTKSRPK